MPAEHKGDIWNIESRRGFGDRGLQIQKFVRLILKGAVLYYNEAAALCAE